MTITTTTITGYIDSDVKGDVDAYPNIDDIIHDLRLDRNRVGNDIAYVSFTGNFDGSCPGDTDMGDVNIGIGPIDGQVWPDGKITVKFARRAKHIARKYFTFKVKNGIAIPVSVAYFSDRTGDHNDPVDDIGGGYCVSHHDGTWYVGKAYQTDMPDGTIIPNTSSIWI